MASKIEDFLANNRKPYRKSLKPDAIEKGMAGLSILLILAAGTALAKGYNQWHSLPWQVWAHLGTILTALLITPVMMLRKRGDKLHRILGWIWSVAMFATALISFDIRLIGRGEFSYIHLLSALTIVTVPLLILSARKHNVGSHRRQVRILVFGALLIAGFFTFPFGRLMGNWLFG
ncbi:DUF2306 domain-containing protein [Sphingorhabdus arenilitoris]|uniref:DUF2306 domain-containing protein n=1 Tax=Sphingorhabdus arenilitoris TaxID=1490041 RepID=A0ABV8RJT3_9SPHN